MDYSKIKFVLELNDDNASDSANSYLKKGWLLISVGTKLTDVFNEQAYYSTSYVVGATQEQYDDYLKDQESLIDPLTGI
ncbi:hypothetical protein APD65_00035 [Listeria monocytogenes]|nr:hypothetical protein [Listeria monocytogenes]EAF1052605.1 hypothetical protein [Listeria monocytogenes]